MEYKSVQHKIYMERAGLLKKNEEVEQIDESYSEELTPSKHGSFSVKSKVISPKEGFHKGEHVGMDTLVHKGTVQHKDNSKPSKFEVHNHVNRGLIFQTHHSDEEKQSIKQHLVKNKMAGKGTNITECAGLVKEDWDQLISESYDYDEDDIATLIGLAEEIQQVLEALPKAAYVSAMRSATDPEGEGKADSDKVVARAKKYHGEKFAKDLESGAGKMHYPRANHTYGSDKLASRSKAPVTKSGKANKIHIQGLKSKIKSYSK